MGCARDCEQDGGVRLESAEGVDAAACRQHMVDQLDRPLAEEETYLAVLMVGNELSLVECVWKVVQKRKEDETGDAAALNEMRGLRLLVEKHFGCLLNSFADTL